MTLIPFQGPTPASTDSPNPLTVEGDLPSARLMQGLSAGQTRCAHETPDCSPILRASLRVRHRPNDEAHAVAKAKDARLPIHAEGRVHNGQKPGENRNEVEKGKDAKRKREHDSHIPNDRGENQSDKQGRV